LLRPTSPELWAQSLDVLVKYRIPHHTEVARWVDADDIRRMCVMVLGTWLARGRGLRQLMIALLALILFSLAVTDLFDLEAVAAITPWRASVLLMPLALAVIVARIVGFIFTRWSQRDSAIRRASWALLGLAVVVGVWRQLERIEAYETSAPMSALRWIRGHDAGGKIFVVPPNDIRFDRFRLVTGQPLLINWKTHPYRDVELLEWRRRFEMTKPLYTAGSAKEACAVLATLVATYDVKRLVFADAHPLMTAPCPGVIVVFRANGFGVAEVRNEIRSESHAAG
jgi:hypothetical protein